MNIKIDKENKFISLFNMETGFYVRTGILDEGKDTGVDPFMADFPELIDIGIMGSCEHGRTELCLKAGVECYQNGLNINKPNMKFDDYKKIIDEASGRTFQVALGGRGDPNLHEDFEKILKYTREKKIVPNFTSSGLRFTRETAGICKEYCGAVAISWYRSWYTNKAIQMLLDAGVKTNIHYVLSNKTINEALDRLKNNDFPENINAVIFLLHKPVGLGQMNNVIDVKDSRVKEFFDLIDSNEFPFKIGFDSCTVPGIVNFTKNISKNSLDFCEGGRFSMYISSDMKAVPCSFVGSELKWEYDISSDAIYNAWHSDQFNDFRQHFISSCPECKDRVNCMGGCPIKNEITLCNRKEKSM